MLFLEVAGTLLLVALLAGIVAVVALPILLLLALIGAVVKVLLFVLVAPIRLIGWILGAGLAGAAALLQGILLTGAAALLIVFGLLPLLPLFLLGMLVFLLVRASRRNEAPVPRA